MAERWGLEAASEVDGTWPKPQRLLGLWGEMEEHSRWRKGIELEVLTIMQLGS